MPSEDSTPVVDGFAKIERLKSLDLEARRAVKVGTIDADGMDKILSLIVGCLITPDMTVISGW